LNVLRRDLLAVVSGLTLGLSPSARAKPARVESFDIRSWKTLQAAAKTPTAVVFSATWCPNCPAVIEDLGHDIREQPVNARLLAVVTDVAPGENDAGLMRHAHYSLVDRLFAFSGQAPALRYSVDPAWRGATPFVVLLAPNRPPRMVTGPPSETDLQSWLQPAPRKP
jgi:thiol-disulfide isomerase/thioredoxin